MQLKVLSALEKVFPTSTPTGESTTTASCFLKELFHYQIAVYMEDGDKTILPISTAAPQGVTLSLHAVKAVPSMLPAYPDRHDDNYISTSPGLFPDLLLPITTALDTVGKQWRSLWVEVTATTPGTHTITITIGEQAARFTLKVLPFELPQQDLIYTQWFHCDCIAAYYDIPVFSEPHWAYMGNFMENAAKYGMNMILTPVLTPPLDTEIGGERPTVQLVDVTVTPTGYDFGFAKLDRYIALATEKGIRYFEMSHPFTQWGAAFAPKVVGMQNGALVQLFGWETSATSCAYTTFIRAFLSALITHLKQLGIFERCYFHVSDEPAKEQLQSYKAALDSIKDLYEGCNVIDALSDYSFYKEGLVRTPIPATNHITPFLDAEMPNLWTYYCCGQCQEVSNRFMAMPSARNRIIAQQLYKYQITGFLHWGYNFWFAQYAKGLVDPYFITDAKEAFPSGDAFSVYPGENGQPLSSIRQMVFGDALQDLRALKLLESLSSKTAVTALVEQYGGKDITFTTYPQDPSFQLKLREAVNQACMKGSLL